MKKMEKKVISITLLLVIVLAMLIPSTSLATEKGITIKDSKLKEEIDANKDGIITEEEMNDLTGISIPEGVTDLTGLEYATNLDYIDMVYNKIMPDLSKLNPKGNIELNLRICSVPDTDIKFDFLKNLKKLTDLSIRNMNENYEGYVELKNLQDIKTLKALHLFKVGPIYLGDLNGISELETLSIDDTWHVDGIINLEGIENCDKLAFLSINGGSIINSSKIGKLKNLRELVLCETNISNDLLSLANCKELQRVQIQNTNISDISFLKNKENLISLWIQDSPIKDVKDIITVVSTLPNIEDLYVNVEGIKIESMLEYNEITDFLSADEPEMENSNTENTEKTSTESKTETKKQAEKPTRIPQAGMNVVGNVISVLVAMSVVILAVLFVKVKRK